MKYKLTMPEGDLRTAKVFFSKESDGVVELCIAVDKDPEIELIKKAARHALLIARNGRYPAVHLVEVCRAFDKLEELTHNGLT